MYFVLSRYLGCYQVKPLNRMLVCSVVMSGVTGLTAFADEKELNKST